MGDIDVEISTVQGPSCVSSTLNVCFDLAGIRTGCGSEADTFISLPSKVKIYRLPGVNFDVSRNPQYRPPFFDVEELILIPMP
jgi:hypothetical protein